MSIKLGMEVTVHRLQTLEEVIQRNGKVSAKNCSEYEKSCIAWLRNQSRLKKPVAKSIYRMYCPSAIPFVFENQKIKKTFDENLADLRTIMFEHYRLPSSRQTYMVDGIDEIRLNIWLKSVRRKGLTNKLSERHKQALLELHEDLLSPEEQFRQLKYELAENNPVYTALADYHVGLGYYHSQEWYETKHHWLKLVEYKDSNALYNKHIPFDNLIRLMENSIYCMEDLKNLWHKESDRLTSLAKEVGEPYNQNAPCNEFITQLFLGEHAYYELNKLIDSTLVTWNELKFLCGVLHVKNTVYLQRCYGTVKYNGMAQRMRCLLPYFIIGNNISNSDNRGRILVGYVYKGLTSRELSYHLKCSYQNIVVTYNIGCNITLNRTQLLVNILGYEIANTEEHDRHIAVPVFHYNRADYKDRQYYYDYSKANRECVAVKDLSIPKEQITDFDNRLKEVLLNPTRDITDRTQEIFERGLWQYAYRLWENLYKYTAYQRFIQQFI